MRPAAMLALLPNLAMPACGASTELCVMVAAACVLAQLDACV